MALKKKGTPEKIKVVKESELDKFKRLIDEAVGADSEAAKKIQKLKNSH